MGRFTSGRWQLSPVRQASGHAAPLRDVRGETQGQERGLDAKTQEQNKMSELYATDAELKSAGFRIRQNVWGNWVLYSGRKRVMDFGEENDARYYAKHRLEFVKGMMK